MQLFPYILNSNVAQAIATTKFILQNHKFLLFPKKASYKAINVMHHGAPAVSSYFQLQVLSGITVVFFSVPFVLNCGYVLILIS